MKFAFTTTPKMLAAGFAVLAVLLVLGSYAAGAHMGRDWPIFIATGLLAALAFSYSCKIDVDLQRLSEPPAPAAPLQRERTHRQELEMHMVGGLGMHLVSVDSSAGKLVGQAIKDALDAMLPPEPSLAEARWAMSAYRADPKDPKGRIDAKGLVRTAGVDISVEDEIQAKGLTAPRVTPTDIQAEIVGEHYFTAEQGARHADAKNPLDFGDIPENLGLLTFCVLRLRNGFTVTGESACASPENFDAAIGRRIARENAVEKVWPLLGFRLRDKLAASA